MFNFDKVQKASVLMEGGVIRLNYIGNDLVIIRGIDMDNAQQLMYLNDDGVIGILGDPYKIPITTRNTLC